MCPEQSVTYVSVRTPLNFNLMKIIRIGLTNNSLTPLLHEHCYVSGKGGLFISGFLASKEQLDNNNLGQPLFTHVYNDQCLIKVKNKILIIENSLSNPNNTFSLSCEHKSQSAKLFAVAIVKCPSSTLTISEKQNSPAAKTYIGHLMIIADQDKIRLILFHTLEEYVQSVLHGEIPSSYHLEAIKAQAVCARTYALNPRVNHKPDFCNVCDSYLCCQCFVERPLQKNSSYEIATIETEKQILTYQNQPVLSLFSSCAGGHTENYEDCFSDLESKAFPPTPLPYLKGVSETLNDTSVQSIIDEPFLKTLWQKEQPKTFDAWSRNFRWLIKLSKQDLESHLHHNLSLLLKQEDFAPFVVPPPSAVFGEVLSMSIIKRGVGGTAIKLKIETSKGTWEVKKELAIRSLFKNQSLNLKRLASAKIFFDQIKDDKGQLLALHIYGLGSGHGVGLQQVGAEGLARLGKNYSDILSHYYTKARMEKI
jgi:SpoIID/LytB domain protein